MANGRQYGAPWGFLLLAIIVHTFDFFLRYGTTPFSSYWSWLLMLFLHTLLLIDASTAVPEFGGMKKMWWMGLVAYVWGPFWSWFPGMFPAIGTIAALMLIIAPFWIIMLFLATREFPRISLVYMIFWVFILTWAFMPQVQEFAEESGYIGISPMAAWNMAWEKTSTGARRFYDAMFVKAPEKISRQIERQIALAKGDFYTSKVDEASKRKLGVFLENLKAEQPSFEPTRPATIFATFKAETIDEELQVIIDCDAEKGETKIAASQILPKRTFEIFTFDQRDIDCIFDANTLEVGRYTARMTATFDFSTRGYNRAYFMDYERLKEFRKQGIDPLEGIGEKRPATIYTSGPVRIRMGLGNQPLGLVAGEKMNPWDVAVENLWSGNILGITNIFFFTPEGITLDDISGVTKVRKASCSDLPTTDEQLACDDTLVNVYTLPPEELQRPRYVNKTIITFRAHISVSDLSAAIGQTPIAVKNFKVSVVYRYQLDRTTPLVVAIPKQ